MAPPPSPGPLPGPPCVQAVVLKRTSSCWESLDAQLELCAAMGRDGSENRGIGAAVSGLAEFMAPTFLDLYHPVVDGTQFGVGTVEPRGKAEPMMDVVDSSARKVQCVTLAEVLRTLGMSHINFWVLDVEVCRVQCPLMQ